MKTQQPLSHRRTKDCYLHGYDSIIMQFIVNSHANYVTESLVQKRLFRNVNDSSSDKVFYFSKTKNIFNQGLSKAAIVYLLMILNVNSFANVILQPLLTHKRRSYWC